MEETKHGVIGLTQYREYPLFKNSLNTLSEEKKKKTSPGLEFMSHSIEGERFTIQPSGSQIWEETFMSDY